MVFTLIDLFVLLFVTSFISKRHCWVGFQRIFFHQLQIACYIAKSKKIVSVFVIDQESMSPIYMKEKKNQKTSLICHFRSCLLLMDLCSATGKKEMELLVRAPGLDVETIEIFFSQS